MCVQSLWETIHYSNISEKVCQSYIKQQKKDIFTENQEKAPK